MQFNKQKNEGILVPIHKVFLEHKLLYPLKNIPLFY